MENPKQINKLIIFIVLAIVLIALLGSFLILNNLNKEPKEFSNLENSVIENQISNVENTQEKNYSKNTNTENSNNSNYNIDSNSGSNDLLNSNSNESNGSGEIIIEAGGDSQVNISDTPGTGGVSVTDGSGETGISVNGSGGSGGIGVNGNINTDAAGNSGVSTENTTNADNGNESFNIDAEIVENNRIYELYDNNNLEYSGNIDDNISTKSNIKEYDRSVVTVEGNEYSNLDVNINLLNAPYNNKEYCERMLSRNYVVKLVDKPKGSICSNYPEKVVIEGEGELNEYNHIYTKVGKLDFTNTYFNAIGDYFFNIYEENKDEALYQIIVSFRYVTTEEGYTTGRTYSLIQIKSILQNNQKVNEVNINIVNPNTSITVDKKWAVNSFLEKVYVNVFIDSYSSEKYTVLDGNALDEYLNSNTNSSIKIGDHLVVRNENNQIVPQTYKLSKDGKIIIGRKEPAFVVGKITQLATTGDISSLGLPYQTDVNYKDNQDNLEIPVGTKYKVNFSDEKRYREEYFFEVGGGDFSEAAADPESNLAVVVNLTEKNPKTGIFYNVAPFIIVIVIAIVGIIIIKKTSFKEDDDNK